MRAKEFLREAEAAVQKKLGRAFNHLEDLVFFHGSAGTMEALEHIKEIATAEGSQSVRMKWDGCIHEETILKTTEGDLTIKEVVAKIDNGDNIKAYGKNLTTGVDSAVDILGTSISVGIKSWVKLELENGAIIKLTEDHEVCTSNRGWVAAGMLTPNDDIVEMK